MDRGAGLHRNVCELRAYVAALSREGSVRSYTAVCGDVLHVRNDGLRSELLARQRRGMEGKSAGFSVRLGRISLASRGLLPFHRSA